MNTVIIVCSRGRAGLRKGTLEALAALPRAWQRVVQVVVPVKDFDAYARTYPFQVHAQPATAMRGLPGAMQSALEMFGAEKQIYLDDDLRFAHRIHETKLAACTPADLVEMLAWLDGTLDRYAHAGISARQGNNRHPEETAEACNMRSVLAVRADVMRKHHIRWDACVSKTDYDVVLSLLELGYPNRVSYLWTHDQTGGPTLAGGNTGWRDEAMHARASVQLHRRHPYVVRKVIKKKPDWEFARTDVVVQWKKALDAGLLCYGKRNLKDNT